MNEIVSTHGYSQNQIMVWKYPSMTKAGNSDSLTLELLTQGGGGERIINVWN